MNDFIQDIKITDYEYELPDSRIAQYPVKDRDESKILIFDGKDISSDVFRNVGNYIPANSLLVFNNTRVIRARLLFQKSSGAAIEILCIEPLDPGSYELSLASNRPVEWKCMIGNLKKWKRGSLRLEFSKEGKNFELTADKVGPEDDGWRISFRWNNNKISFGEVIEASGHIPLPPYIKREDAEEDSVRYQTVYSKINGSVAAPTAGLHFTENTLRAIAEKGIRMTHLTLHVGAGTFQPVRNNDVSMHEMHCEHFFVTLETIDYILESPGRIIAVGTTSVRTLESLFWLGVKCANGQCDDAADLIIRQSEPYTLKTDTGAEESLLALKMFMNQKNLKVLHASTKLIILPGYKFRMIKGMITNFHQPRSTLLLLVSAWTGSRWRDIYDYAMNNSFRFLSYGDSSLLFSSLF